MHGWSPSEPAVSATLCTSLIDLDVPVSFLECLTPLKCIGFFNVVTDTVWCHYSTPLTCDERSCLRPFENWRSEQVEEVLQCFMNNVEKKKNTCNSCLVVSRFSGFWATGGSVENNRKKPLVLCHTNSNLLMCAFCAKSEGLSFYCQYKRNLKKAGAE